MRFTNTWQIYRLAVHFRKQLLACSALYRLLHVHVNTQWIESAWDWLRKFGTFGFESGACTYVYDRVCFWPGHATCVPALTNLSLVVRRRAMQFPLGWLCMEPWRFHLVATSSGTYTGLPESKGTVQASYYCTSNTCHVDWLSHTVTI